MGALASGAVSKQLSRDEERLGTRLACGSLADEPMVRPILQGVTSRVRLDRKATFMSLLVVIVSKVLQASYCKGRTRFAARGRDTC